MLKGRYPGGIGDGDLVLGVAAVAPLVGSITGRNIAGKEDGEDVPAHLRELALRGIALKTEQFLQAVGSVKLRKSSLSRGNLQSFSAGSYSESYFGPGQMISAKKLDADPVLADVLWALCTQQAKLEWLQLLGTGRLPLRRDVGDRLRVRQPAQLLQRPRRPSQCPRPRTGWLVDAAR